MFIVPIGGRLIPDPFKGDYVPAAGREVARNQYWLRRWNDGDLTIDGTHPMPVPVPPGGIGNVPNGGLAGQVLVKRSSEDGDVGWADMGSSGGGGGGGGGGGETVFDGGSF